MIYNQKQRQLIIWEQRDTMKIVRSVGLLLNLGMRISVRNLGRKYFSHGMNHQDSTEMVFANEQVS